MAKKITIDDLEKDISKWKPKDYTPFFLYHEPTHTPKEIRAEYSRMRDILVKRAKRLYKAGGLTNVTLSRYIMKKVPKLKDIKDDWQLAMYVAEAKKLIDNPAYSLKGIKEIQKTIYDETGTRIPLGEVLDFHNYMKSWRTGAYRWLVDTNTATRLYETDYKDYGGTFDEFYSVYIAEKNRKDKNNGS